MQLDSALVGRSFAPTDPYLVTEERVRAFATATGGAYAGGPVPATFPIVLAFDAMNHFLEEVGVDLSRIVHGEQKFRHERPIVPGDELQAALTVTGLRQIGGNDIITTTSDVTDAEGALVCAAGATLVHRGDS